MVEHAKKMPGAVTKLNKHALHCRVDSPVRNNDINMIIIQVK